MNPNIQRFDERAGVWDENPVRAELARSIVRMAEMEITGIASPRMMDYGCGTGMCSIPLAHRASSLLAVDVSCGMLAKLREKADALALSNVETLQHDLSVQPLEGREFDVIITAMALHHVRDVALVLKHFHPLLSQNGVLLIADLDREDGSFHEDPTGVEHHGFKRDWMLNALWDAGFRMAEIATAHTIVKPAASGGEPRSYPVFFMAARVRPER
jgi:ubiquinone/menaquinone biosynthesis C-methylase UbiE